MFGFYRLDVQPALSGAWFMVREWGRIGCAGRVQAAPVILQWSELQRGLLAAKHIDSKTLLAKLSANSGRRACRKKTSSFARKGASCELSLST